VTRSSPKGQTNRSKKKAHAPIQQERATGTHIPKIRRGGWSGIEFSGGGGYTSSKKKNCPELPTPGKSERGYETKSSPSRGAKREQRGVLVKFKRSIQHFGCCTREKMREGKR